MYVETVETLLARGCRPIARDYAPREFREIGSVIVWVSVNYVDADRLEQGELDILKHGLGVTLPEDPREPAGTTCVVVMSPGLVPNARKTFRGKLPKGRLAGLTARQTEVLRLAAEGLSNKEISRKLHCSLYTVKNHVHSIYERLRVKGRWQAMEAVSVRQDKE